MIRDTMLVPEKLQVCLEGLERGKNDKHENLVQKVARFTDRIAGSEAQKQRSLISMPLAVSKEGYIAENLTANDMVEHSIREYCGRTKERFEQCSTFDMTRQFLVDHIQRIIYLRSKVTILGSAPVKRGPFQAAVPVPFRIEGELDRKAIRAKPHKVLPDDGRWKKLKEMASQDVRPAGPQQVDRSMSRTLIESTSPEIFAAQLLDQYLRVES